MKIRKARLGDIERIKEIFKEGIEDELKTQFKEVDEKMKILLRETRGSFHRAIKNKNKFLIVAEDKGLIGFGLAEIKEDIAKIDRIYVDRKMRRKGVGKKIFDNLLRWSKAKKPKRIDTYILVKNKPSIGLHKKFKFIPEVIRMSYRIK